jgi:hypothetical protein
VAPDRGDSGLPFGLEWHEKWWIKAADPLQNYSAVGLRTWMRKQRQIAAPLRMSAFMYHLNRYVLPHLDVATARQLRCAREFFAELAEHVDPAQLRFDPFAAGSSGLPLSAATATVASVAATLDANPSRIRLDGDFGPGVGTGVRLHARAAVVATAAVAARQSPKRVFRLAALLPHLFGRDADDAAADGHTGCWAAFDHHAHAEAAERAVERDGLLRDLVRYEWLDGADLGVRV